MFYEVGMLDQFVVANKCVEVGNYLIAYAPDEEPLLVLAVLDGRRRPRVLATILRERK